jgi:hypothetical protein
MAVKHGMRAKIGRELGITGAAVAKLAVRGMPLDDADAARRWRAEHLAQHRMRPDPGPSPETLVSRANKLGELAAAASGSHAFDAIAGELREAMRAVPESHRMRVVLPFELINALIGVHALRVLNDGPKQPAGEPMSDEDAEFVGHVCYQLACGEAVMK